ncbi:MAG: thioredoxin [Deltaproteobacteria bacterium]|nr:thioredoxin [Deltaproteobacteria bacterium]
MAKSKAARNASKKKKKKKPTRSAGSARPGAGRAAPERQSDGPVHIKSVAHFEQYLERPEPAVVDFWATWCVPCKMMAPIFERVSRQFKGQANFLKVNTEELGAISNSFGIRSIPTMVILVNGDVVDSHVGVVADGSLVKMTQRAIDKAQGVGFTDKLKRFFGKGKTADTTQETPAEEGD